MKIFVNLEVEAENKIRILLKKTAQLIFKKLNLDSILSITVTNAKIIKKLNREFRRTDKPTDVLAFEMDGRKPPAYLGDVVISLETVRKNARHSQVDEMSEIKRVAVHGILHLLGYQHGGKMRKLEEECLKLA